MTFEPPDWHESRPGTSAAPTPDEVASLLQVEHLLDQRWPETRIEPSLIRISALMDLLGSPQLGYPSIHIAGTNGKTSVARMVDALVTAIVDLQARVVVAPLGLGHPDHIACHATALAVRERTPGTYWLWYSDLPYAYIPRVLSARFRALHRTGFVATPACPVLSHDFAAKWRALCEYTTQVAGLDRLWRLRDRLERGGRDGDADHDGRPQVA